MNLKGGYILLNLCAISLALSGEPVTITNANVLKKLSAFQMYVGTDEFKSQPKIGLKPVLVQYRSNESKINGVILCKCGFDTNNKKLIISGTDGEKLSIQIECVFIDNPEDVKVTPYILQSAKVTAYRGVIGDLDILGDLDIDGDLSVSGSINGEVNPSVKPLYYHAIVLINTDDAKKFRISFWIITNDDTPYDKTSFLTFLGTISDINYRLNTSGLIYDSGNSTNLVVSDVSTYSATSHTIRGFQINGVSGSFELETLINQTNTNLVDAVNKLN